VEVSNGSPVAAADYEKRARSALLHKWEGDPGTDRFPLKMWALLLSLDAVVYALLEIARAIREARS
jgi:hypothetical protein